MLDLFVLLFLPYYSNFSAKIALGCAKLWQRFKKFFTFSTLFYTLGTSIALNSP